MKTLEKVLAEREVFKKLCSEIDCGEFPHSLLLVCDDVALIKVFCRMLAKKLVDEDVKTNAGVHPDVLIFEGGGFLTAESQELIDKLGLCPLESEKKVAIVIADEISKIVQNKLLKTLEEPTKNTHIILCARSLASFLPTIKSRCRVLIFPKLTEGEFLKIMPNANFNLCGGSLDIAESFSDEKFLKVFKNAEDTLINLKQSKDVVLYSRRLAKTKQVLLDSLKALEIIFNRILKQQIDGSLKKVAQEFDLKTSSFIVQIIAAAYRRIKNNCNIANVADELLLSILEVKYKCKQGLL